jgi:hypothetical protein
MKELQNIIGQRIIKKTKSKGNKAIGYLAAGLMDEGIIAIGYSLCHANDQYDFVNKRRVPGFGRDLALNRAIKYSSDGAIQVPPSIFKHVQKFAARCERYYKGGAVQAICAQKPVEEW